MRNVMFLVGVSLFAVIIAIPSIDGGEGKKQIKPAQQWNGKKDDKDLIKLAPKAGYFTNQVDFEKLWAAWMLKDKAPAIDFAKQLVFVQLASGGPNVPSPTYTLDANGDLTVRSTSTLIAGPGFGYSIDVLNRPGIKSYMGKPIEDAKEKK